MKNIQQQKMQRACTKNTKMQRGLYIQVSVHAHIHVHEVRSDKPIVSEQCMRTHSLTHTHKHTHTEQRALEEWHRQIVATLHTETVICI